ncbi:MAG: TetR/AcrR family transcriptional regulator [Balneolaceae bacterium]|nr:TetR/AcrR family transcriptional regulator [Balneolaceae bacterium]
MSPRTPRQNEEIRKQSRQQIIDAAFQLFANEGFAKTSISAVAEKAGISKGLIYHYFDSKEGILEAIFNQLVAMGDEILDFNEDSTPAENMRKSFEETFMFIQHQTGVGRLMISLALQPDAFESLKDNIEKVQKRQMETYVGLLRELGYEEPETEAYKIGALMDGILLGYVTMGNNYPLEEMKQKIIDEYVPN